MINLHKLCDINSRSAHIIKLEGRNMEKARAIFLPSRGYIWLKTVAAIYIPVKKSPKDGTGLLGRA